MNRLPTNMRIISMYSAYSFYSTSHYLSGSYAIKSFLSFSGMLYTAVKSYKATKDDEITVTIGSVVEVLQKSENGWWLIRYSSCFTFYAVAALSSEGGFTKTKFFFFSNCKFGI